MKKIETNRRSRLIGIIFILIFSIFCFEPYAQVNFQKGTLAEMFEMAKVQNKVLMIDVMTDWCKWCVELDNKVYSNPDMYKFANENQINYKIDAEKGEGVDFAKKYEVTGYPTVLFLNADGSEVDRIIGYVSLEDFVNMMKDYNKGVNTMVDLKKKLEINPDDIIANLKMADKLMMLGKNEDAKANLNKIIDIDPQNLSGKVPEAKYDLAAMSDIDHIIQNLKNFIKDYPNSDKVKDAYINLAETYFYSKKDKVNADNSYKEVLTLFANDEMVKSSYGQYLNSLAVEIASDSTKGVGDYKQALGYIDEALPNVKGSVNEASSYYIQAKLMYNLKEFQKASESIDKAIIIFDRKLYRDLKDKIQKSL